MEHGQEVKVNWEKVSWVQKSQVSSWNKAENPAVSNWSEENQRVEVSWNGENPVWVNADAVEKV